MFSIRLKRDMCKLRLSGFDFHNYTIRSIQFCLINSSLTPPFCSNLLNICDKFKIVEQEIPENIVCFSPEDVMYTFGLMNHFQEIIIILLEIVFIFFLIFRKFN